MHDLSIIDNNIYGGIIMDNNIDVLDELNKGCSMGIEALDIILKKVEINMGHKMRLSEFTEDQVDLLQLVVEEIRVLEICQQTKVYRHRQTQPNRRHLLSAIRFDPPCYKPIA